MIPYKLKITIVVAVAMSIHFGCYAPCLVIVFNIFCIYYFFSLALELLNNEINKHKYTRAHLIFIFTHAHTHTYTYMTFLLKYIYKKKNEEKWLQ
jgi:hypothetical protein